jgi:hypothetical protein
LCGSCQGKKYIICWLDSMYVVTWPLVLLVAAFAITAHTCCVRCAQLGKESFKNLEPATKWTLLVFCFWGVFPLFFSVLFGKSIWKSMVANVQGYTKWRDLGFTWNVVGGFVGPFTHLWNKLMDWQVYNKWLLLHRRHHHPMALWPLPQAQTSIHGVPSCLC